MFQRFERFDITKIFKFLIELKKHNTEVFGDTQLKTSSKKGYHQQDNRNYINFLMLVQNWQQLYRVVISRAVETTEVSYLFTFLQKTGREGDSVKYREQMVCNFLVDSDLINDIIEDDIKRKEKTSVYVSKPRSKSAQK